MSIAALTKNYKFATNKGAKVRQKWQKPPEGKVKVNVTFDESVVCVSVGTIIRNSVGVAIAASHSYIPHLVDASMAEAYALKEGLMLAQFIGCNRLIVQSDCMEVVERRIEVFQQRLPWQCMMNATLFRVDFRTYPLSIVIGMQIRGHMNWQEELCNLSKIVFVTMSPLALFLIF